jgi:hypothetical protein
MTCSCGEVELRAGESWRIIQSGRWVQLQHSPEVCWIFDSLTARRAQIFPIEPELGG